MVQNVVWSEGLNEENEGWHNITFVISSIARSQKYTYSSIRPKQIIEFGATARVFNIKATKIIVYFQFSRLQSENLKFRDFPCIPRKQSS